MRNCWRDWGYYLSRVERHTIHTIYSIQLIHQQRYTQQRMVNIFSEYALKRIYVEDEPYINSVSRKIKENIKKCWQWVYKIDTFSGILFMIRTNIAGWVLSIVYAYHLSFISYQKSNWIQQFKSCLFQLNCFWPLADFRLYFELWLTKLTSWTSVHSLGIEMEHETARYAIDWHPFRFMISLWNVKQEFHSIARSLFDSKWMRSTLFYAC